MSGPWYHVAFGGHYPSLYRHRDADEAARAVAAVAEVIPLSSARVLDLGCGAGRHLPSLRRHGADVVGLDLSADLLSEARRAEPGADLVRGDWAALPWAAGYFEVVLSLFTAFGYGASEEDHVAHLNEVARALSPGGSWCLDYFNVRRVRTELATPPPPRERPIEGGRVREERRLSPQGDRVLKRVRLTPEPGGGIPGVPAEGLTYEESVALLDLPRLDELAAASGLRRFAGRGDYDGAALDPDASPRWLLFFRKEGR